jgi:hypothetical protein
MPPMPQRRDSHSWSSLDSAQTLTSAVCCSPQESFNLLAAMALWAGLQIGPGELRAEVLVVAARPQPKP